MAQVQHVRAVREGKLWPALPARSLRGHIIRAHTHPHSPAAATPFYTAQQVPLIIRCPWRPSSANQRTGALTELLDLYPTVSSLLGAPTPDGPGERVTPLEGIDISSVFDLTAKAEGTASSTTAREDAASSGRNASRPGAAEGATATTTKSSPTAAAAASAHVKDAAYSLMPRCEAGGGAHAPVVPYTGWCRPGRTPDFVGYSIRTLRWRYTAWVAWRRAYTSDGQRVLPWIGEPSGVDANTAWEEHVAMWREGPAFEELYYFPPPPQVDKARWRGNGSSEGARAAQDSDDPATTGPNGAATQSIALRDAVGWLSGNIEDGAHSAGAVRSIAQESEAVEACLVDFNLCEPVNLAVPEAAEPASTTARSEGGGKLIKNASFFPPPALPRAYPRRQYLETIRSRLYARVRAYFECQHEHACIHPAPPPPPIRPEPPHPPPPEQPPLPPWACGESERANWCARQREALGSAVECSPWLASQCEKMCGLCDQVVQPPPVASPSPEASPNPPPTSPPCPVSFPPELPPAPPPPPQPPPPTTPTPTLFKPSSPFVLASALPPHFASPAIDSAPGFTHTYQTDQRAGIYRARQQEPDATPISKPSIGVTVTDSVTVITINELGVAGLALLCMGVALCGFLCMPCGRRCDRRCCPDRKALIFRPHAPLGTLNTRSGGRRQRVAVNEEELDETEL